MPNPFTKNRDTIDAMEFTPLSGPESFYPESNLGISKYRADLGRDTTLDAMLVNQGSDFLIVSCHGALPRKTTVLPRFERLRTFLNTSYSSMFFGDPTLHLSEELGLAWYTGWPEVDVYHVLADWVKKSAEAVGADKIIFVGSSGGGLASLQVSSLIPGSLAVPLNPQTAISKYQPQGSLGYSRNYVKNVMPQLTPEGGVKNISAEVDWSEPLGERASALVRYAEPLENYVYYAQNLNDVAHRTDHYEPFREVVEAGPNKERVRYFTYDGQHTHTSPKPEILAEIMAEAVRWISESSSLSKP